MANLGSYLSSVRQTKNVFRSFSALRKVRLCSVLLDRKARCYSTSLEGKTVRIGCASGFWGDSAMAGIYSYLKLFIYFFFSLIAFIVTLSQVKLNKLSMISAPQLVRGGKLDYLMFDYLSEITMSLLTAAKHKSPVSHFFISIYKPK